MLLSLLLSFSVVPCLVVLPINLSAQRLGSASLQSRAPKVGFRGVTMRMFDGETDRTTANRTTESSCEFASATPNEKKQWHIFFFFRFFCPQGPILILTPASQPTFFPLPKLNRQLVRRCSRNKAKCDKETSHFVCRSATLAASVIVVPTAIEGTSYFQDVKRLIGSVTHDKVCAHLDSRICTVIEGNNN